MLEFIKWFWVSLSIKNWAFEKRKMDNPFCIVWCLFWIMPYCAVLFIFCIVASAYTLDKSEFTRLWENN